MIQVLPSRCPQNHRCPTLRVCPTDAITQHGNAAPVIDEEKCIDCGKCTRFCAAFVQTPRFQPSR